MVFYLVASSILPLPEPWLQGTIPGAAGFMIAFGLGTFPAMFLLSYFGFLIHISTRNTIKKAVPYVVA
jgi:sulfite exporter TauE/SafE